MSNHIKDDYTIDYINEVSSGITNTKNLYITDSWLSEGNNSIPDNWNVSRKSDHNASEDYVPRIKVNSGEAILALRGSKLVQGIAPSSEGYQTGLQPPEGGATYWRWAELDNFPVTMPVNISFKVLAGGTSFSTPYGLGGFTDASVEKMWFQYYLADVATWTTIKVFNNGGSAFDDEFVDFNENIIVGQDTEDNSMLLRFICRAAATTTGHWGIKDFKINPIVQKPFRLFCRGPMNIRGQNSNQFYKIFTGEQ